MMIQNKTKKNRLFSLHNIKDYTFYLLNFKHLYKYLYLCITVTSKCQVRIMFPSNKFQPLPQKKAIEQNALVISTLKVERIIFPRGHKGSISSVSLIKNSKFLQKNAEYTGARQKQNINENRRCKSQGGM